MSLPSAKQRHGLVCKIKIPIVLCRVEYRALELVYSRYIGPLPRIEKPRRVDDEMTPVLSCSTSLHICDFHIPLTLIVVPFRTRNEFLELTVLP